MSNKQKDVWVNASDVGKAAYCPYSLYLAKQNIRPDSDAAAKMKVGTKKHESWSPEGANGFTGVIWFALKLILGVIVVGYVAMRFINYYAINILGL